MLCCFFRSLWERDSPLSGKITSLGSVFFHEILDKSHNPSHPLFQVPSAIPGSQFIPCTLQIFLDSFGAFFFVFKKMPSNLLIERKICDSPAIFSNRNQLLERLLKKKTWRNVDSNNFRNGKRVNAPCRNPITERQRMTET